MKILAPLTTETEPTLPVLQKIEVATFFQIPNFQIIGLPGPEISEARERVRAAILSSGLEFPKRRVIVNLSPASIKKRGTGIDLAIALAILVQARKKPLPSLSIVASGELGLDGSIKPVGQLSRAIYAAWKNQADFLLISDKEHQEAYEKLAWVKNNILLNSAPPKIIGAESLTTLWKQIENQNLIPSPVFHLPSKIAAQKSTPLLPLNPEMERLLLTGLSGHLHILLVGPKGTGKSHALEWLIELLPRSTHSVKTEQIFLHEFATSTPQTGEAPIRRVNSHIKPAALIGGITRSGKPIIGECSLAHGGMMIADEFPEWSRDAKEALREPLERGVVSVSRAEGRYELPARFILAMTGNLCPCGGWPLKCICTVKAKAQYLRRISGPVLDRLDLALITRPQNSQQKLKSSDDLKEVILQTRKHLKNTWGKVPGLLTAHELENLIQNHFEWENKLASLKLRSLRSRHKILRIALTLAGLDQQEVPNETHFDEAAFYHPERLGL